MHCQRILKWAYASLQSYLSLNKGSCEIEQIRGQIGVFTRRTCIRAIFSMRGSRTPLSNESNCNAWLAYRRQSMIKWRNPLVRPGGHGLTCTSTKFVFCHNERSWNFKRIIMSVNHIISLRICTGLSVLLYKQSLAVDFTCAGWCTNTHFWEIPNVPLIVQIRRSTAKKGLHKYGKLRSFIKTLIYQISIISSFKYTLCVHLMKH